MTTTRRRVVVKEVRRRVSRNDHFLKVANIPSSCAPPARTQSAPSRRRPSPRPVGFAASGGNATRQLAAVRGVGPRRVSSSRRRRRRDPRGLAPPRGTGVRRGAARPSAPRANQPDRPSLPMTRRQAALATMGLRVCHGRSQQRHALHRSAGRRVAPRAPRFRPPHSHRDRRCDADKSARGQPRHAATSPTARFISAHFHWRKSVPHPVTEYGHQQQATGHCTAGVRLSHSRGAHLDALPLLRRCRTSAAPPHTCLRRFRSCRPTVVALTMAIHSAAANRPRAWPTAPCSSSCREYDRNL